MAEPNLSHQLLQTAAETKRYAEVATAALGQILAVTSARTVALVRASPPDWQVIAAVPQAVDSLPSELLADALDRDELVKADDWTAVPLTSPGSENQSTTRPQALLVRGEVNQATLQQTASDLSYVLAIARRRRQLERQVDRLAALLKITNAWRQTNDLLTLLEQMAEAATELFDCDRASLFLWDQSNRTLVGRPAMGVEGGELRVPDDAGVVGYVLNSGEARRVAPSDGQEIDRRTDEKTGYQTETLLAVPMTSPDGVKLGVFELINKHNGHFTPEDERGLMELADYAAVALTATQEFEELLQRKEQLIEEAASGIELLGECAAISALRSTIKRVADTDLAILVLGENGTGKEVVARTLHYGSRRRSEPLLAVNCAAITESLLESELFGHEAGAFTDAREARAGKFELASGGTLFLDEIGDMSLGGQAKLLRVLEDKTVVRVGGSVPIVTDVRVIAATNQDLTDLVRKKKFREDLYFRLNVVSVNLPPLRDRGEDILLLAEHFFAGFCRTMGRKMPKLMADAKKRLLAHTWPGNVRELRNLMERLAYLSTGDRIEADELAFTLSPGSGSEELLSPGQPLNDATAQFQTRYIRKTIERATGNVTEAAKQLGVHRSNLYRKMKQLGMTEAEE